MKILFLTAEATPLVKIGGLADVAGELPRELGRREFELRVAMPLHSAIRRSEYPLAEICRFPVPRAGGELEAVVFELDLDSVRFWLIDGEPVRVSTGVYGQPDQDGEKYAFSAKAALLACEACAWYPDVVHANDWHAAAAVNFLARWREEKMTWSSTRTLLTIHNLAYMGSEASRTAYAVPEISHPHLPGWAERLPLPSGIASADWLSTVSPTYAREIQTPEFGCGLDGLLAARHERLTGIMNGIDMDNWDPEQDPALEQSFSLEALERRRMNKTRLQAELGLPDGEMPSIGMITRLDHQKGVDLALEALEMLLDEAWQFVLLGTGDPGLEILAREFEARHADRMRAVLRFDEPAARRLYASSDMLLIPSRYEPCGLAQLIGMRYGAVPVVRATGGLKDSVPDAGSVPDGTGFVFEDATVEAIVSVLHRALAAYQDTGRWRSIQRAGMQRDHSWTRTASAYADLYRTVHDVAT